METVDLLRLVDTLAFLLLGAASVRGWRRNRDAPSLYLALSLGLLGITSLVGRINEATEYQYRIFSDLSLVLFILSGFFLMRLRDVFIRYRPGITTFIGALLGALAVAALVVGIPPSQTTQYTELEASIVLAILVAWSLCVGEPVIRFWRSSRGLPPTQRGRMRSLSLGLAGIILILLASVAAGPNVRDGWAMWISLSVLALVPMLYVSFSPPDWLRRAWEEGSRDITIAEDLAVFAPDLPTISKRVLKHALSIAAADSGYIRDTDGRLLAMIEITEDEIPAIEAAALAQGNGQLGDGQMVKIEGRNRYAIVLPLEASPARSVLTVVSGPFTPLFGSYELDRLREFGAVSMVAMDRVRLVEALSDETDRYQALLQAVSDLGEGFVITEDTRLVYANDAFLHLTGYTMAELRALASMGDLAPPQLRAEFVERFSAHLRGEVAEDRYESQLVHMDGQVIDVEVSLKLTELHPVRKMITIVRDISDRKRSEVELRQKTEAVRLLQLVAVAANESRELREALQVTVDAVCAYSGWPVGHVYLPATAAARELMSAKIWHLADNTSYAEFKRITESTRIKIGSGLPGRVMESGRPQWVADVSLDPGFERKHPDVKAGFAFPILIGRHPVGILEFFTNETTEPDENLLEVVTHIGAQLGRAAEREQIDKLRDEFISNAAHELRTPVTSIVGFASLLSESEERMSRDDLRTSVGAIARQGERLRSLVNNMLDFTRVQQGRLKIELGRVDIREALQAAVEVAPSPNGKVVEVQAPGGLVVHADPTRLDQIFTNLLTNAYRYGGNRIILDALEEGDEIVATVTDNGPGVPDAVLSSLFDPFMRGDTSNTEGSGLGLAIVRMLAQLQGGDVDYRPGPGGGAQFLIRLPRP